MEYGWYSLLPPLVAIALAMLTRRVVPALGAALVVGGFVLTLYGESDQGIPRGVFHAVWTEQLYPSLTDPDHWRVFIFSLTLGAMVGIIEVVGGMEALVRALVRRVRTRRSGQMLVWLLGLAVFFDDYANTLLLGTTMRSTADRLRFSRAKLAYLVDSTAAPVAGLALVSTWVATEISYIADGLAAAGVASSVTAFSVFIASVPFRFYAILALVLVAIVAWSGRDLGPMVAEEQSCLGGDRLDAADPEVPDATSREYPRFFWLAAVVPVVVCVSVVIAVLVHSGLAEVGETELRGWRYWGQVIGGGDSSGALIWGSVAGLVTAVAAGVFARGEPWDVFAIEMLWGAIGGAAHILPAMLVLWLAWSLSGMTDAEYLDTGGFLGDRLRTSGMPPWTLPTAVFVVAGVVALATGTSWGTMGLLTPLSIQLAVAAGALSVGRDAALADGGPLLVAVVGAVLAGSIFGDHCSPISDTTVLSSRASGCNHMLHVRTQIPYAMLGAVASIVFGTIPSGFGFSPWASLVLGVLAMWVFMRLVGTRIKT